MQDSRLPPIPGDRKYFFIFCAVFPSGAHLYKTEHDKNWGAHTLSGDKSLPLYDGQEATRYPERENTASRQRDAAAGILRPVAYGRSDNDA